MAKDIDRVRRARRGRKPGDDAEGIFRPLRHDQERGQQALGLVQLARSQGVDGTGQDRHDVDFGIGRRHGLFSLWNREERVQIESEFSHAGTDGGDGVRGHHVLPSPAGATLDVALSGFAAITSE
ncbi:hypothetical protein MTBUT4_30070 [Magnetospirillum sp. UT-4]|nr:hypothetical protein MTBUT4_30070 [Magnetospirillum sp. UT-4]